jgi:dolichyl-phosphate-mannose-protein mannosyltransferase
LTQNGTGDANDVWRVVIEGGQENEILETVRHRFKLVHYLQNCVLTTTKKQLPKWSVKGWHCNLNI